MGTLPILLNNPKILLIGGGKIALHKARILAKNGIEFSIITAKCTADLAALNIPCTIKPLEPCDIDNFQIVIDATGNSAVAEIVLKKKITHNILFNCVDQPELCDFFFSSLLNYGNLKIAVSTDGLSPTIGQEVRDRIATIIPAEIEQMVTSKGIERERGIVDTKLTRQQCQQLFAATSHFFT